MIVGRQVGAAQDVGAVEAADQLAQVDHVLGALGESDDLGLARQLTEMES